MGAQRLDALAAANTIRSRRVAEREALAEMPAVEAGARLADLIAEPPGWFEGERVFRVLMWIPHWGPWPASRLLRRLDIAETVTVGHPLRRLLESRGLTKRQRAALVDVLRGGTNR